MAFTSASSYILIFLEVKVLSLMHLSSTTLIAKRTYLATLIWISGMHYYQGKAVLTQYRCMRSCIAPALTSVN